MPAPQMPPLLLTNYLLANLLFYPPNYLSLLIKTLFPTGLIIIPGVLRGVCA
mgnify:FL=1|jgi:hypothetical protein